MNMRRVINLINNDIKLENIFKKVKVLKSGSSLEMEKSEYEEYRGDIGRRIGSGSIRVEVFQKSVKEDKKMVKEDLKAPVVPEVIETPKADEVKADEVKADEVKTDEVKTDEVKTDEVKTDEAKADNDKGAPKLKTTKKAASKKVKI